MTTSVCFSEDGEIDTSQLGTKSCVTRFIKKMLSIVSDPSPVSFLRRVMSPNRCKVDDDLLILFFLQILFRLT